MRVAFLNKICLAILLGIMGVSPVWGQEGAAAGSPDGHDIPGAIGTTEVCPCTFGPLIADTAVPLEKGKFAVQPYVQGRFTGGSFSPSWRRISAGGDYFSLELPVKFAYGLTTNLEVNVYVRYKHNWAANVKEPGPQGERAADFGGFGDTNLTLKYRLIEEKEWWPTVTGLFSVDFPTGHNFPLNRGRLGTDAIGNGVYGFYYVFNVSKWVNPWILYANLWHYAATSSKLNIQRQITTDTGEETAKDVKWLHGRDLLMLRLAAEYPLGGKGPWVLLFEFYGEWETGRLYGPKPNSTTPAYALMGFLPGLEYVYSDKLAFAAGLAMEVAGKNANFEYTPIISMTYIF